MLQIGKATVELPPGEAHWKWGESVSELQVFENKTAVIQKWS